MSEPRVIVVIGRAAARLVDELVKNVLGRYAIAVIGDEPRLAYNRVLLSSVLAGETASHEIELKPAAWWRDRGVTVKYGCGAPGGATTFRTTGLEGCAAVGSPRPGTQYRGPSEHRVFEAGACHRLDPAAAQWAGRRSGRRASRS